MPDPIVPAAPVEQTDQTGPLDAGHTTTEYALAKWAVIAGIVLSVLSTVVDVTGKLATVMPGNTLITKVGVIAGALMAVISSVLYGKARTDLKVARIQATAQAKLPAPSDAQAAVRS